MFCRWICNVSVCCAVLCCVLRCAVLHGAMPWDSCEAVGLTRRIGMSFMIVFFFRGDPASGQGRGLDVGCWAARADEATGRCETGGLETVAIESCQKAVEKGCISNEESRIVNIIQSINQPGIRFEKRGGAGHLAPLSGFPDQARP